MRTLGICLALAAMTVVAVAQAPGTQYKSSSDVSAMIAKAKKERKADQANFSQHILELAPYNANLEYRAIVGPAATHEKEAELFYVIEGGGTLITGGKLVDEKRTGENSAGTAIEGGTSRTIAKGDFVIVPENTPHWFSKIDGVLTLMSFHVPRGAGH